MKILHTSDWHLGQQFYGYDRSEEHDFFIKQLCQIMAEEAPDALLVCGDVFDQSSPSIGIATQFVNYILDLHDASKNTSIFIIAGNHDSGSRLEIDKRLWEIQNVHIIGRSHKEASGFANSTQFLHFITNKHSLAILITVPFFNANNYPVFSDGVAPEDRQKAFFQYLQDLAATARELGGSRWPVIEMAHLPVSSSLLGSGNELIGGVEVSLLDEMANDCDYLALGHIHKAQRIHSKKVYARYCGSPLPVNFSESSACSITKVEIEEHGQKPTVTEIPLKVLREMKTIPYMPAPLDLALDELMFLDDNDESYIRLNIHLDDILPPDAQNRAEEIAKNKKCRFCGFNIERNMVTEDSGRLQICDIKDLREMDPMNVAQHYYEQKFGVEMDPALAQLLEDLIDTVNNEKMFEL